MSGKSSNEKNHEHSLKIEKREHQEPILKSKDFYYYRSRERLSRHLRWGLRHKRSMEGKEKGGSENPKIFIGFFCFEIKETNRNLTHVNVANDFLIKELKKPPRVASKTSYSSKKKTLRRNVKKSSSEHVSSKSGKHLKLC